MPNPVPNSCVVALLGPTNTGKTHFAMERMLAQPSGMIGFPLRLLARENYDRAVDLKGRGAVALITGEEKILPPNARYFICTVESMPVDRIVDFLAVDEIQMCADPDRGHAFTDRLLHARGREETMFLGAATMRPLLRHLVPDAEFRSRPRFSTLTYAGVRKTTRLPKRTAVVAFSAADVYQIAELVRRQRGGAAVVMGALSPRTRNAQVEMYQSGEVDYLVATDAIGMGLNMDVDHVAFADTRKFDGRRRRRLEPAELAQIAGRAGRHMTDGTFGTTADAKPLDEDVASRIENHEFEPVNRVFWRNPAPDFSSLEALQASLSLPPQLAGLARARPADDEIVLKQLADDPLIVSRAADRGRVRLLWEVCQIPDYGNVLSDGHAQVLGRVFTFLTDDAAVIPNDWIAGQVARLDRVDGDFENLTQRIAGIRTWTYVAFRGDWLADSGHWRELTRAIEDRLSDALHDRLTQRFVDRRSADLVRKLEEAPDLIGAVKSDGDVVVEGHFVGRLEGFRFMPDFMADGAGFGADTSAAKAVKRAALSAVRREISVRVGTLEAAPDEDMALGGETYDPRPEILWSGRPAARLARGQDLYHPDIRPEGDDLIEPEARRRLVARLETWLTARITGALASLVGLPEAGLTGAARGLAFQLGESLGTLPRTAALREIEALTRTDRKALRAAGVRIGRESVYLPALLKPEAVAWRALLWRLYTGSADTLALPAPGRVSVPVEGQEQAAFLTAIGYRVLGRRAFRIDMIERLSAKAWALAREGDFEITPELLSLAGCGVEEMTELLKGLDYRVVTAEGVTRFRKRHGKAGKPKAKGRSRPKKPKRPPDHSPFAKLGELEFSN